MPDDLSCRVVSTIGGVEQLRADWHALLERSPRSTLWQAPEFLLPWWRHMARGRELRIFVVERDSQPCLIMPLQLTNLTRAFGFKLLALEPVGMPLDVNRPRLGVGPDDPAAYACALEEIWRRRDEWHVMRIFEIAQDDPELDVLRLFAAERGLKLRQRFLHLSPWLDLRQSWERYIEGRGAKLRKNLRVARRRLEERGAVTLRSFESPLAIHEGYALLLALYLRSAKKGRGIEHDAAAYTRFQGAWLDSMAALGRARILVLFVGAPSKVLPECAELHASPVGVSSSLWERAPARDSSPAPERPVAATLAFTDDNTYYSAQIVHDAEFNACSPGTLLESLELEDLMRSGRFATYDFMGSFLNNKLRWTDTATRTSQVYVFRKSLRCRALEVYAFAIKPLLRRFLSL